jgi:hypothetical protein
VEDTAVDKDKVPFSGGKFLFVQGSPEFTLQNANNFILHMPVVGHDILGMVLVHMVELKGKIIGSPLLSFVKVGILHKITS